MCRLGGGGGRRFDPLFIIFLLLIQIQRNFAGIIFSLSSFQKYNQKFFWLHKIADVSIFSDDVIIFLEKLAFFLYDIIFAYTLSFLLKIIVIGST